MVKGMQRGPQSGTGPCQAFFRQAVGPAEAADLLAIRRNAELGREKARRAFIGSRRHRCATGEGLQAPGDTAVAEVSPRELH